MPTLAGPVRGFNPLTLKSEKVVSTSWVGRSFAPSRCMEAFDSSMDSVVGSYAAWEPDG